MADNSLEFNIDKLLKAWNIKAVIFDLDGTLIDNNSFHLQSWRQYLKNIGREISEEEYKKNINGRTNKDAIEYIYARKMNDEEALKYALEKEAVYRKLYEPHIKPVTGLMELLGALHERQLPMAIATSGIQVNIDFMFSHLPIEKYFKVVVNSAHITMGKPDPEIYIKTAALLGIPQNNCLVFEDAAVGVSAAKSAGMKVIAITTTQCKEELSNADMIIHDYTAENFLT
ncbi:MAG: family phosphatase [Chitinophagaceae bacterium]|nr:family phosphatase [Chitinophagaceae bacterium]